MFIWNECQCINSFDFVLFVDKKSVLRLAHMDLTLPNPFSPRIRDFRGPELPFKIYYPAMCCISPLYTPHFQRLTGTLTPRLGNIVLADDYTCMTASKFQKFRSHLGIISVEIRNLYVVMLIFLVDDKTFRAGTWCSIVLREPRMIQL